MSRNLHHQSLAIDAEAQVESNSLMSMMNLAHSHDQDASAEDELFTLMGQRLWRLRRATSGAARDRCRLYIRQNVRPLAWNWLLRLSFHHTVLCLKSKTLLVTTRVSKKSPAHTNTSTPSLRPQSAIHTYTSTTFQRTQEQLAQNTDVIANTAARLLATPYQSKITRRV